MSEEIPLQAIRRIGEHAAKHALTDVRIIDHGGEPLLRTAKQIDVFSTMVRQQMSEISPGTKVHLGVTTSGGDVVTPEKVAILKKHNYSVSLSLDGDLEANDRHRRSRTGESTYDEVVRTAQLLRDSGLTWKLLAVVDTDNDPQTILDSLASHKPPSINLLLPHANHSVALQKGALTHGAWLKKAFDWYFAQPAEGFISIPYFENLLDGLVGTPSTVEAAGGRISQELFILPNGHYQRVDTIKSTEPGAVATTFNIFEHSIDEVARFDPGIRARRLGEAAVAPECQRCPLLKKGCGGGYYPHRFKSLATKLEPDDTEKRFTKAFQNPTVYCAAQKQLIGHMAVHLEDDLAAPRGTILDVSTLEPIPVNAETVTIDAPTLKDIPQIIEVHNKALRDAYINAELGATVEAVEYYTSSELSTKRRTKYWEERIGRKELNGEDIFVYVARDPNTGRVVGFTEASRPHQLRMSHEDPMSAPSDAIHAMYVDPDFQQKGIGSVLLSKVRSHLRSSVRLIFTDHVKGSARTRAFYERHGFRTRSWLVPTPYLPFFEAGIVLPQTAMWSNGYRHPSPVLATKVGTLVSAGHIGGD